jgi:hypothetical protein
MGERLTDEDEILFRQIHPSFVEKDGHPSSQPFHPTDKDYNKLSADRSTITDAAGAFALYIGNGHKLSTDCLSESSRSTTYRACRTL